MIRNEKEYRHAASKISGLENELQKLSSGRSASDEVASAVVDALRIQIEDVENEISEYEDLKEGRLLSFGADDLDSLGELVTKARIARGLTQAELGEILGTTQQQVARYERDGWQKISLWRLAEAADALGTRPEYPGQASLPPVASPPVVGACRLNARFMWMRERFG